MGVKRIAKLLRSFRLLLIFCLFASIVVQIVDKTKSVYRDNVDLMKIELSGKPSVSFMNFPTEASDLVQMANRNLLNQKYLVVSLVNFAHWELALNLMLSLKRSGVDKFLIFCSDAEVFAKLNQTDIAADHLLMIPPNWLSTTLSKGEGMWDSQPYVSITHAKTEIVAKLLSLGFTVFFNDVDIVWLSNDIIKHIEAKQNIDDADIIFTWDGAHMNTGCYIVKPSEKTKLLYAEALLEQSQFPNKNDQYLFNAVLERLNYTNSAIMLPLDRLLFPNGCTFFRDKLNQAKNITPMIVHANCLIGVGQKKASLKANNMWFLDDTNV